MSSTLKITRPMTRTRRIPKSQRRFCRARKSSETVVNGGSDVPACSSSVSDKLEALRNLIPAGEVKSDQLFQKTADYIVLLKTQVLLLQKLVDFYGSKSNDENDNAVY